MNCFLFKGLTEEESETAKSYFKKTVTTAKSENIYKEGYLGIIVSGKAVVKRNGDFGNTVNMRTLGCGDLFGAASIFGEWKEGKSLIIAETACTVAYITEQTLKELFIKIPAVSLNYIAFLSDRIRFLNKRIDAFTAGSAENMLYEFLSSQADKNGNITLGYGMTELSRRLKIGRSSLYRSIEALEKANIITRHEKTFTLK